MSLAKVRVTAQYSENYAWPDWDGKGECPQGWKQKGGSVFEMEIDSDVFLYADPKEEIFQELLDELSNDAVRYTFLEYDIEFEAPTILDTEKFVKIYERKFEEAKVEEDKIKFVSGDRGEGRFEVKLLEEYDGQDKQEDEEIHIAEIISVLDQAYSYKPGDKVYVVYAPDSVVWGVIDPFVESKEG